MTTVTAVVVALTRGDDRLHRPRTMVAAPCCTRPTAKRRNRLRSTDGDGGDAATVAEPAPSSFRVDGAVGDGPPGAAAAAADGVGGAAVDGAGVAGAAAVDVAAAVAADDGDDDGGKPRRQRLLRLRWP